MFRNIVYSVCCIVALLCGVISVDNVKAMRVLDDSEVSHSCDSSSLKMCEEARTLYGTDFEKWKSDGERFCSQPFIEKLKINIETVPHMDDGKPEILQWLAVTSLTSVFFVDWAYDERYGGAEPFFKNMLRTYSQNGIRDGTIISEIEIILETLDATRK